MSDERRERYAAAIFDASAASAGDFAYAEAAMAVADAELAAQRHVMGEEWAKEYAGNASLRAELADTKEDLAAAESALNCKCSDDVVCADLYTDAHSQWTAEINENASLRAELERASTTADSLARALAKNQMRVERVRAAARKAKDSGNVWDMDDLISAALDADS